MKIERDARARGVERENSPDFIERHNSATEILQELSEAIVFTLLPLVLKLRQPALYSLYVTPQKVPGRVRDLPTSSD